MKIYRFWLTWAGMTVVVLFLIALFQMFAREQTLDSVRIVDFRAVFASAASVKGMEFKNFKVVADEIATENKKFVLFPMALLNEQFCSSNGENGAYNSLCRLFSNIGDWRTKVATQGDGIARPDFFIFENQTYLFRFLSPELVLIGDAGAYSGQNGSMAHLKTFLYSDAPRYFSSRSGLTKIFEKTGSSLVVVAIFSLLFAGISFTWLNLKYKLVEQRLRELRSSKKDAVAEWEKQKDRNIFLKADMKEMKVQIADLKKQKEKDESDNEALLEELIKTEEKNRELEEEYRKAENSLKEYQEEIDRIEYEERQQVKKGSRSLLLTQNQELKEISELWRRETPWEERIPIEKRANSDNSRVPFTTSLAFIAFEKYVDELCEVQDLKLPERPSLEDKCVKLGEFDLEKGEELKRIRRARNAWVHDGKIPKNELIDKLVDLISNQTPPL